MVVARALYVVIRRELFFRDISNLELSYFGRSKDRFPI